MMLGFALFFVASLASASPPPETRESGPDLLILGEQKILRIPELQRFSLGGNAIRALPLGARPSTKAGEAGEILIKGVAIGSSDLWIWKTDGTREHRSVRVEKGDRAWLEPRLLRALGRLEEAEVLLSGEGVVVRGTLRSWGELYRVAALAQGFPKEVQDDSEESDELLQEAVTKLEAWRVRSRFSNSLQIERNEARIRIQGSLTSAADRAWVEKRTRALYPRVELNLEALPDDSPTVHFRVFLLELKKNRFGSLGIAWPGNLAGAFRMTTWGIREALQFDLALQALEGEGAAKILSRPELVVRAPGEAELFAGGEIPIQSHTRSSSQLSWKSFGLMLKLKVTHKAGQRVRLEIQTEVSHLDENIALGEVPGLQANRMRTQVDARFGEPLFLSGLLQEGVRKQAKGLPFLRRIPVLGSLFGSEDYLQERSELVAILLPLAAPPRAPMERMTAPPKTSDQRSPVAAATQSVPKSLPVSTRRRGPRTIRPAPEAAWRNS